MENKPLFLMNSNVLTLFTGKKITKAREEKEMSVSDLADSCNVSEEELHQIELGNLYCSTDLLIKLGDILGVRASWFLKG